MREEELFGAVSEARFLRVANDHTDLTPTWFMYVESAGIAWDIRGIDSFAYLTRKDSALRIKVPIQIKSSESGKKHFEDDRRDPSGNIIIIVVSPYETDDEIRSKLYEALDNVRERNIGFEDFLRNILQKYIPREVLQKTRARAIRQARYRAELE